MTDDPNCADCDDTGRTRGPEDVLVPCGACSRGEEEARKDKDEDMRMRRKLDDDDALTYPDTAPIDGNWPT